MKTLFQIRFFGSQPDNRKSKIQNRKLVGLVTFVIAFVICGAVAKAQQTGKVARIGFLDQSTPSGSAVRLEAFRQELSKLGWIEGKNIAIEYRFAEQKPERIPELTADLVRLKVDLIMITDGQSALAAKGSATNMPMVVTNAADPVRQGLVASLARPGGNITGLSSLSPELITKRLEILKDTIPKLSRVGLLRLPGGSGAQMTEIKLAALALKVRLEEIEMNPTLRT